jgi:ABC-type dipeptide/oligopeptide/nickel transport system permease subunit
VVAAETAHHRSASGAVARRAEPTRLGQIIAVGRREPRIAIFGSVIGAMVLIAIFAPIIAPYDPYTTAPATTLQQPSWAHLLGTDSLGRDQLSRVIWGTRISLVVAGSRSASHSAAASRSAWRQATWAVESTRYSVIDAMLAFRASCWPSR